MSKKKERLAAVLSKHRDFQQASLKNFKLKFAVNSQSGAVSGGIVSIGGVKGFVNSQIDERRRAKAHMLHLAYAANRSIDIADVSDYVKARNLNKRKRIKNK